MSIEKERMCPPLPSPPSPRLGHGSGGEPVLTLEKDSVFTDGTAIRVWVPGPWHGAGSGQSTAQTLEERETNSDLPWASVILVFVKVTESKS